MKTAVEWFFEQIMYADVDIKVWREIYDQAKKMEFEQRKKDFVNGYKSRAKESNLIFDETSEMYAIKLFNETFKSE
jgi:hypothetical protein